MGVSFGGDVGICVWLLCLAADVSDDAAASSSSWKSQMIQHNPLLKPPCNMPDVYLRYEDMGVSPPLDERAVLVSLDKLTVYGLGRVMSISNPRVTVEYMPRGIEQKTSIFETAAARQVVRACERALSFSFSGSGFGSPPLLLPLSLSLSLYIYIYIYIYMGEEVNMSFLSKGH